MNSPAPNPESMPKELLKLDIGCGKNKTQGFTGVDQYAMEGVDVVFDVAERITHRFVLDGVEVELPEAGPPKFTPWPWDDESVVEVRSSHFLEHLDRFQRVHFFNELYRVMAWGGTAQIQTPHWSHECAYGDPTHQWPATSGWYANYLQKFWRVGGPHPQDAKTIVPGNAPHADISFNPSGFSCDFDWGVANTWDPWLNVRNHDTKVFWMQRGINSSRDLIVNLTKTKR